MPYQGGKDRERMPAFHIDPNSTTQGAPFRITPSAQPSGTPSVGDFYVDSTRGLMQYNNGTYSAVASVTAASSQGAVGDGITDDTAAINAAITVASGLGGGVVQLAAGTFLVTNLVMKSRVILRGAGMDATTIKLAASTTHDVIDTNGTSGAPASLVGIEDLTVNGNKSAQSSGVDLQQYGINLNSANDSWVNRVKVVNTQRSGIYISGSRNTVTNCVLSGIGKVGAASSIIGRSGIVFDSDGTNTPIGSIARNNRVIDCLEHGIKVYPGGYDSLVEGNYVLAAGDRGVYLQGNRFSRVANNVVDGATTVGIFVGDGSDAGIGNVVTGNTVTGILQGTGGHGILVQNQTDAVVSGNQVSGCYAHGIYVLTAARSKITGNGCHGNGTGGGAAGIKVYSSPHSTVSGNVCSDNGTNGSKGQGIYITDDAAVGSLHVVVSANRCYDTGSSKQDIGVLSDSLSDYTTLSGNDLVGNVSTTYTLAGSHNTVLASPHTQKTFGPFVVNGALTASTTPQMAQLYFTGATAVKQDTTTVFKPGAACHVVGLTLMADAARTAGSITMYANGGSVNATACTIDGTNTRVKDVACAHDLGIAVAAGATLTLTADISVGYTPLATNLVGYVTVSYD